MVYKVIHRFADMQDKNHVYEVGDVFPYDNKEISEERIMELASSANKIGKPIIEKVANKTKKKAETITEE